MAKKSTNYSFNKLLYLTTALNGFLVQQIPIEKKKQEKQPRYGSKFLRPLFEKLTPAVLRVSVDLVVFGGQVVSST